MKAQLRRVKNGDVNYYCLAFCCPGCIEMFGGSGLHMLAVNTDLHNPAWEWDWNLYWPTVSPSILTGKDTDKICHSFLVKGIFQFLSDCTHSLAGQHIPMPDLPDWFINEE